MTTFDTSPSVRQAPHIDPRMARRVVDVRRAEGRRRLRVLVGCAATAATLGLLIAVAESPLGAVRHVRVQGASTDLPAAAVEAAAGIGSATPMVHVGAAAAASRVEALPRVATARIVRQWPATVRIVVTTRTAVGIVSAGASSATVDRTGRVLAKGADAGGSLPVLDIGSVALPPPGRWVAGAPGPEGAVAPADAAGAATDVAAQPGAGVLARELALAVLLPVQPLPPVISLGPRGLQASIGSTTVVFGDPSAAAGGGLAAEVAALSAVEAATPLGAPGTLDLTVTDRPVLVLTCAIGSASGSGSASSGSAAAATSTTTAGSGAAGASGCPTAPSTSSGSSAPSSSSSSLGAASSTSKSATISHGHTAPATASTTTSRPTATATTAPGRSGGSLTGAGGATTVSTQARG